MLRAIYEGVAYNLRWIIEILEQKYAFPMPVLRVIGGGSKGLEWMQIIADIAHRRVETITQPQMAGALGAAFIATVGLGIYPDFSCASRLVTVSNTFHPQHKNAKVYDELYRTYKSIYFSLRKLYRSVNFSQSQKINSQVITSTEQDTSLTL